jgi:hypothetical protein
MASIHFQSQNLTIVQLGQFLAGLVCTHHSLDAIRIVRQVQIRYMRNYTNKHQTFISLLVNCIYRLYFHPIFKYPGPKLWAVTALPSTYYTLRGTKAYRVAELHNRYGPVRQFSNLNLIH